MAKESIPQNPEKFQGKNEYYIYDDIAEMILYTKGGVEKCRTIIDSEDVKRCAKFRWFCNNGYVVRYAGSGRNDRHELKLHDFILQFKGSRRKHIDHKSHNTFDNRKGNLRVCTRQQNLANNFQLAGVSGFRGVYPASSGNRWRAIMKHNGVRKQIGAFGSPEEAAIAWNAKALELRGEFAVLNDV